MVGVVLEGDAAEEEGDDAGHGEAVGEEVAGVGAEGDEAGLDLGDLGEEGVFARDMKRPKAVPRAMEAEKEKMLMPWKMEASLNSVPWSCESVLHEVNTEVSPTNHCYTYSYMTILTAASLRSDYMLELISGVEDDGREEEVEEERVPERLRRRQRALCGQNMSDSRAFHG